jgi:hypothetical protein
MDSWCASSPSLAYLTSNGIAPARAQAWLDETSSLRTECGCKSGAAFFFCSVSLGLILPIFWVRLSFAFVIAAALLSILALAFGKRLGKYLARRRLLGRITAMRAELRQPNAEGSCR